MSQSGISFTSILLISPKFNDLSTLCIAQYAVIVYLSISLKPTSSKLTLAFFKPFSKAPIPENKDSNFNLLIKSPPPSMYFILLVIFKIFSFFYNLLHCALSLLYFCLVFPLGYGCSFHLHFNRLSNINKYLCFLLRGLHSPCSPRIFPR